MIEDSWASVDAAVDHLHMQGFALSFVTGILSLFLITDIPESQWVWGTALLGAVCLSVPRIRWLAGLGLGVAWAFLYLQQLDQYALPAAVEGKNVVVHLRIDDVPQFDGNDWRFTAQLIDWNVEGAMRPKRMTLSWYAAADRPLQAGDVWRLSVRLKRPWGNLNPGSFDREKYLFHQAIQASGYVRDYYAAERATNMRLGAQPWRVDQWRQALAQRIGRAVDNESMTGAVLALSLGLRDDLSAEQWRIFQATGTSHLVAISGLHVGMVAGLFFWVTSSIWRRNPRLTQRIAAQKAATVAAILAAFAYALFSGFAIPAQRAFVMVAVAGLMFLRDQSIAPGRLISTAALVVVLLDPTSVLSAGFWLSFAAVFILLLYLPQDKKPGKLRQLLILQIVLVLLMLPLTIGFFQQGSLLAPLANLIAIPVIGLVILPLLLVGIAALGVVGGVGEWLLNTAAFFLARLFDLLERVSGWDFATITLASPGVLILLLATAGLAVALAPLRREIRAMGVLMTLPLWLNRPSAPAHGEFEVTVLDVGQGSAYFVRTHDHSLLFDTGPGFDENSNAGEFVLVPYLRQSGVTALNQVIISHADLDHVGGLPGILRHYPSTTVVVPHPTPLAPADANLCLAGQRWRWDGVVFEFLNPDADFPHNEKNRNNGSCVLKLQGPVSSMLFTGDIESGAERALMRRESNLSADVMTVPHHGSRTSSGEQFLERVNPVIAVVSAGYRNSFGHPKPDVVQRYRDHGADVYSTITGGAITFRFRANGDIETRQYRVDHRRYWHSHVRYR